MIDHPPSVKAYFARIGADVLNFRRAMVRTPGPKSYYDEKALVKIDSEGQVTCSHGLYAPTKEEAEQMKIELSRMDFPRTVRANNLEGLREAGASGTLWEFWDRRSNSITMVQERVELDNGKKFYRPWTMLSDGSWVAMEPDGKLPFWKPKQFLGEEPGKFKIMIHEGAKAAAGADAIARGQRVGHPWEKVLKEYIHFGMIGGALAPSRTDYEELVYERPLEVVYCCDNDDLGETALKEVSRAWARSLKGVKFGAKWPVGWDMADEIPPWMFDEKTKRYIGPGLRSLYVHATWATEMIPPASGKGAAMMRILPDFRSEWYSCVRPDVYVHKDWPDRIYPLEEFNSEVAPFSHAENTGRLLKKEVSGKAGIIKYIPGEKSGVFGGSSEGVFINTFVESDIEAEPGDPGLWLRYMEYLIPEKRDREELYRWIATLVMRPEIRMKYGVLLISEMQGVGKSTLGEKILRPLVGEVNCEAPTEKDITESAFNGWIAHKRLAIVNEIYAGNSSLAYNNLKSIITDTNRMVNKKFQTPYNIELWIHIFACSNSLRALKIDPEDRRWFVPKVTELKWPEENWDEFFDWIKYGPGLGVIKWWCGEYLKKHKAVRRGEDAPQSEAKREVISEGYSPGQRVVMNEIAKYKDAVDHNRVLLNGQAKETWRVGEKGPDGKLVYKEAEVDGSEFMFDTDLVRLIKARVYEGRQNDRLERPLTVRNVAKTLGLRAGKEKCRSKVYGRERDGAKILTLDAELVEKTAQQLYDEGRRILVFSEDIEL